MIGWNIVQQLVENGRISRSSRPVYGRIRDKTARNNVVLFAQDKAAPSCPYEMPFGFWDG
ncbi:MAG TPA: hypothetical protein EYP41_19065 [Anaerolineae bacterium]|nr:hypothetical protein [Anaerolineae bacterium]HIP72740.1 hypothetical protein [Anaerolineae bacterium]